MSIAKKVVVIGLDSAGSRLTEKYIAEGLLPNMKKVKENGVFIDALCPFPTLTPSNWTTISTGTWPGTHGITDFYNHHHGEPLDKNKWGSGFDSRENKVELIWEPAEREGKGTILINYPASWPPRTKKVWQVMGCGLGMENELKLNSGQLFTNEDIPLASKIELKPSTGWTGIKGSEKLLETEIKIDLRGEEKSYYLLLGKEVSLHRSKDYSDILTKLEKGVWSDWIKDKIDFRKEKINIAFKLKLMDYELREKRIKLFLPEVFPTEGFTHPPELSREIVDKVAPFMEEGAYVALNQGLVGDEEFLELIEYQDDWYAKVAKHLMKNKDWELLFLHAHGIDYAQHKYLRDLGKDKNKEENLKRVYKSADRLIGEIYKEVSDDVLFIVVSDHGATSGGNEDIDVYKILQDAGLLSYEEPFPGLREIDWEKTKAIPNRTTYIYVNLKGRDPEGSVEPEQYEKVREEIIRALKGYRDSNTGESPFSFIMKKEEARILGLYGEGIGDIVYSTYPEFSSEHGRQHPAAWHDVTSLESLLIMSGPGVKRNYHSPAVTFLTDIVPTICYLMDIPVPAKCEGKIIYDALLDPNLNLSRMKKLSKEREALAKAYGEYRRLTHS